jgi:phytoene dehydrogenase-like protein
MASYLITLGGEIVTGFNVEEMKQLPPAKAYLFDVSPKNLAAIAGDQLPEPFKAALMKYRHGPAAFKLDWALSDPIPWANEACARAACVHVGGTMEEISMSERAAWSRTPSDRPFVLLAQPTLFDKTRAPEGKHIAWGYCHVPNGYDGDMTDAIESQIERFAPGFRQTILARAPIKPKEFELYNPNYVGGDIVGGVQDLGQLFTRPTKRLNPYTTPNPSIFICSASTPPGGGVHGMCGLHCATTVLKHAFK